MRFTVQPALRSRRLIAPEEPIKKRGTVEIAVYNGSPTPFDFGSENVTARLADGTAVPIITPAKLASEEKGRLWWRNFGARAARASAIVNSGNEGWSTGTVNYRDTTTSRYGSSVTSGMATTQVYNPAQAQAARALANIENQQTFDQIAATNEASRQALRANLKTSTVYPGGVVAGLITFELPPAALKTKGPVQVTFDIRSGGEQHIIEAMLAPL